MKKETWKEHQTRLKEKYSDYDAEDQTMTVSKLIKELSKANHEAKVVIDARDEVGEYHYYPIKGVGQFYGKEKDSICIKGRYF